MPGIELKPRRCRYCRATFLPKRGQDKDARFCCPNHRKAFWRYGGLPYDKMREQVMKDVRKELRALHAELLKECLRSLTPYPPNPDCRWCHGSGVTVEHGTGRNLPCQCLGLAVRRVLDRSSGSS